jgi:hypothetical protein
MAQSQAEPAQFIIRMMMHARGRDGARASRDDGFT